METGPLPDPSPCRATLPADPAEARRPDRSEAALLAAGAHGPATPLRPDWAGLFRALPALGPVLAGTGNGAASVQRQGRLHEVCAGPGHVLVVGAEIDLRLLPGGWAFGFALGGAAPALRFFDEDGRRLHHIDAVAATDRAAWQALVAAFADPGRPAPPLRPAPAPRTPAERPVDAAALRADWRALRDWHGLAALLHRHRATRRQAYRLAGPELARRLSPAAAGTALRQAAAEALPLAIAVGNRHALQWLHGVPPPPRERDGWLELAGHGLSLRLRQSGVAEAWHVTRPSAAGPLACIELLDAAGEPLLALQGARRPGQGELPGWTRLAARLDQRLPSPPAFLEAVA